MSEESLAFSGATAINTTGRQCSAVPLPPNKRLEISDLYDESTNSINTEILRDHLKQEGRLTQECALKIIREGTTLVYQSYVL
jgi:hypothetical protein